MDMPEEEEESAKLQSKKGAADVTRGSNILNKVVTRYHYCEAQARVRQGSARDGP